MKFWGFFFTCLFKIKGKKIIHIIFTRSVVFKTLTGPQVVGSHYCRQLEMMYVRNITSGEGSSRRPFFH